jgi:hypothetical protein
MKEESIEVKNLKACAKNLIATVRAKQWERLDSKVWALENALKLLEESNTNNHENISN